MRDALWRAGPPVLSLGRGLGRHHRQGEPSRGPSCSAPVAADPAAVDRDFNAHHGAPMPGNALTCNDTAVVE